MGASSDEPSASSTVASSARLRPSPRAGAVWPSPRGSCVIAPRAALPLARSTDAPREHHCSLHRVAGAADEFDVGGGVFGGVCAGHLHRVLEPEVDLFAGHGRPPCAAIGLEHVS